MTVVIVRLFVRIKSNSCPTARLPVVRRHPLSTPTCPLAARNGRYPGCHRASIRRTRRSVSSACTRRAGARVDISAAARVRTHGTGDNRIPHLHAGGRVARALTGGTGRDGDDLFLRSGQAAVPVGREKTRARVTFGRAQRLRRRRHRAATWRTADDRALRRGDRRPSTRPLWRREFGSTTVLRDWIAYKPARFNRLLENRTRPASRCDLDRLDSAKYLGFHSGEKLNEKLNRGHTRIKILHERNVLYYYTWL